MSLSNCICFVSRESNVSIINIYDHCATVCSGAHHVSLSFFFSNDFINDNSVRAWKQSSTELMISI